MGKAAKRQAGDKLGDWQLEEEIGGGGNGTVWRVSKPGSPDCAMKVLKRLSETTFARFAAEIDALKLASGISGIVPLIDHDLPRDPVKGPRWFVMPLAGKFESRISGREPITVVQEFVPLAETLAQLHSMAIHHRDIKPSNLLALGGRLFSQVSYKKGHYTRVERCRAEVHDGTRDAPSGIKG